MIFTVALFINLGKLLGNQNFEKLRLNYDPLVIKGWDITDIRMLTILYFTAFKPVVKIWYQ